MQPLTVDKKKYLAALFDSHDFQIFVDVLDMNEKPKGSGVFLDGQVNLHAGEIIHRTASVTVSDPDGAFDFNKASEWSGQSMWADRLIRVRHRVNVPGVGAVTVTPFIGPPSTITRDGPEVTIEAQDKTALAIRGSKPLTINKGTNCVTAIRRILQERTGEFRFRMPSIPGGLSKPYNVGWDDEVSPWAVARKIAVHELGMQLIYSCDGYVLLRDTPTGTSITVPHATGMPSSSVDFTDLNNYVMVKGKKATKTKGNVTTTTQPEAVSRIRSDWMLSPEWLARKGVPRYWPLIVSDDALNSLAKTKARADRELAKTDQLDATPSVTIVPFFHGDITDRVRVKTVDGDVTVALGDCSIPLGVGGDMTIGARRWVSTARSRRTTGRVIRTRKVRKKAKKKK